MSKEEIHHHAHKEHHSHEAAHVKEKPKKKRVFLTIFLILFIIALIISGGLAYIYFYQPEIWNMGEGWAKANVLPLAMKTGEAPAEELGEEGALAVDYNQIQPEGEPIPGEYFAGHASAGGEITIEEAEKSMRKSFNIEEGDVVMGWPEKIEAGEWVWEEDKALGPVGKLSSDGWLFWVDPNYGGMYPHPTYYIVVYGDGFVDTFMGDFTPQIGEDSWIEAGTKAKLIQGSLEIE